MANIKVNTPAAPRSGQIVTFTAVCDCASVTDGLIINGETYTVCDAMGECVTGKGGAWCAGAQISVVLDCENKKAYIQNAAVPDMTIANVTGLQDALDGKVPIATSFTMVGDRVKRIQTGGNSGENGNITNGGIVLGQTYQDLKNPESGIGSMRGTRNYGIFCGCDYTDGADETTLGARSFVIKALDTLYKRPSALLLQGSEGGIKYFLAKEKRVYEQNELLEMDEFDVLHTGNMESLGCGKIYRGTYTGTGTYGDSNPTTLAFNFVPKLLMVSSKAQLTQYDEIFVNCGALTTSWQTIRQSSSNSYSYYMKMKKSEDGKTIYIIGFHEVADANTGEMVTSSSGSASQQCNASGTTYHVTAW